MERNHGWLKPGWPLVAIFIILSYAVYGHTLHFPFFVFDDGGYILVNELVKEFSFKNFFGFWINSKIPVPYNIWQVTYAIFGETPGPFRFTNILFHGATSYMIFKVLYNLSSEENRSKYSLIIFTSVIFFLIHPMNVESVVWISSLNGILSLFFALLAYDNYLNIKGISDKESLKPITFSIVFYTLSLLSKPSSAVFPVIFIMTDLLILNRNIKEKWWLYVYYFSLTFALSLLHVGGIETVSFKNIGWFEKIFVASNAMIFYVSKVLLPFKLHVIYPNGIFDVIAQMKGNQKFMMPVLNFSIFCFLVALLSKKEYRKISCGLAFFFILLIPTSGIIPFEFQKMSYVADRYIYHALFGIVFSIVFLSYLLLERFHRIEKIIKVGALSFLALFFIKNFSYSANWVSNSSILGDSYKNASHNPHLGLAYANSKSNDYELDESLSILSGIYEREPGFNEALSTIVNTFAFRCDSQRTQKILNLFSRLNATLPLETLLNKAQMHVSVGELDKAYTILLYIESSHLNLSDMAATLLDEVKRGIDSLETNSYFNIGYMNFRRYKFQQALDYFTKGRSISRDNNQIEMFDNWINQAKDKLLDPED